MIKRDIEILILLTGFNNMTEDWKNTIKIPYGAWDEDKELCLSVPASWNIHVLEPANGPEIDNHEIEDAFNNPIGTSSVQKMAIGKRSVAIAVDDITRPTPTARILPILINELRKSGLKESDITIIIGTGAHRPMNQSEVSKKLGEEIVTKYKVRMHDFSGQDIRYFGWVKGGPVYLNSHFLDADLRICIGCVMGNNNMGFGGGAKMIVPGLAGHLTIAHFHGVLPDRPKGQMEAQSGILDKRIWAEQVAQQVGIDLVVCTVLNSRRQLAGIYVGDVVKAHRMAAKLALQIGETIVSKNAIQNADIVIVNSYPLDNAPMLMDQAISITKELSPKCVVAIDAASDGVFYHGMGGGLGIDVKKIVKHFGLWLYHPEKIWIWLKSIKTAFKSPFHIVSLTIYTFNYWTYEEYQKEKHSFIEHPSHPEIDSNFLLYSKNFPEWAFRRWRFRKKNNCRLFRDWGDLIRSLSQKCKKKFEVLVIPCAPVQFLKIY